MKSIFRPILQSISNLINKILPVSTISNYSLLIVALLLSACKGSGSVDALLRQAEDSVMVNAAYTAAMLDTLPVERLTTASQRALYGLLLTQSHTRLHDTIPSDSLISSSVGYYEDHGSDRRLMLSLYYLGQTRLDHGQYAQALVPLLRSYEMATAADDHHWTGMTARALSDLYNDTYNRKEELEMAILESEAFRREGDSLFIAYAELDRARAMTNNFRYDEAIAISDTILNIAERTEDFNLGIESLRIRGLSYVGNEKWAAAVENYDIIRDAQSLDRTDSIKMAESLIMSGDIGRGKTLIDEISVTDDLLWWHMNYIYFSEKGPVDSLALASDRVSHLMDDALCELITQYISGTVQNYHRDSKSRMEIENSVKRHRNIAVFSLVLLIIGTLSVVLYLHRIKLRQQLERSFAFIEELNTSLHDTKHDTDKLKNEAFAILRKNYSFYDSLLSSIGSFDRIKQKELLNQIQSVINYLMYSDDNLEEIVRNIDMVRENVITRFKNNFPGLPEQDYRLFIFMVLGFSTTSLVTILNAKDVKSVYDRKYRLRKKIESQPNRDTSEFLRYFDKNG